MTDLHPSIQGIKLPRTFEHLPISAKGFPVPWFVAFVDGEPDFRIVKPNAVQQASRWGICWLCGYELGQTATYVSGPMCGINRVSAEPPSHHACADYAAKACPFLARPHAKRGGRDVPEGVSVAGTMIARNPGVAMLWRSASMTMPWRPDPASEGLLFRLPDPLRVDWICEGRPATFEEVQGSIATGVPLLQEEANREGPEAVEELFVMVKDFYKYMPHKAPVPA